MNLRLSMYKDTYIYPSLNNSVWEYKCTENQRQPTIPWKHLPPYAAALAGFACIKGYRSTSSIFQALHYESSEAMIRRDISATWELWLRGE